MARCPKCHTYYAEPEDEQGEHECPHCGAPSAEEARYMHEQEKAQQTITDLLDRFPDLRDWLRVELGMEDEP